jgi:hypothetical protein
MKNLLPHRRRRRRWTLPQIRKRNLPPPHLPPPPAEGEGEAKIIKVVFICGVLTKSGQRNAIQARDSAKIKNADGNPSRTGTDAVNGKSQRSLRIAFLLAQDSVVVTGLLVG